METKKESVMMSRIVEAMELVLTRNLEIRAAMTHDLNMIYPAPITEDNRRVSGCNEEEPRDYCHKISMLLMMLEDVTNGHEENLRHLKQIV